MVLKWRQNQLPPNRFWSRWGLVFAKFVVCGDEDDSTDQLRAKVDLKTTFSRVIWINILCGVIQNISESSACPSKHYPSETQRTRDAQTRGHGELLLVSSVEMECNLQMTREGISKFSDRTDPMNNPTPAHNKQGAFENSISGQFKGVLQNNRFGRESGSNTVHETSKWRPRKYALPNDCLMIAALLEYKIPGHSRTFSRHITKTKFRRYPM